ncbi:hypothetical protein LOAG_15320 [Loa loa]|uniref:Uncharacterized protein n=1 Tax=Loa loa TaxID=7209 RepID=A0A1S0TG21_LOALO|nr:hypothetical protein LOAG_15320 [Loa loa]EFO13210.1 hypothetical protein LOAG_15320 [Loa loa]
MGEREKKRSKTDRYITILHNTNNQPTAPFHQGIQILRSSLSSTYLLANQSNQLININCAFS